jgi:hypothetical protein
MVGRGPEDREREHWFRGPAAAEKIGKASVQKQPSRRRGKEEPQPRSPRPGPLTNRPTIRGLRWVIETMHRFHNGGYGNLSYASDRPQERFRRWPQT